MNLSASEPKDGDFVAYLEEIERQQLAHLTPHAHASLAPSAGATGAAVPRQTLGASAQAARATSATTLPTALVGNIVLGVVGLFFLLLAIVGDGGLIAGAIGAFLVFRALQAVARELRNNTRSVRSALAQTFESMNRDRS